MWTTLQADEHASFDTSLLTQMAIIDIDQSLFRKLGHLSGYRDCAVPHHLEASIGDSGERHQLTTGAREEAREMELRAVEQVERYEGRTAEENVAGKTVVSDARDGAITESAKTVAAAREEANKRIEAEMPKIQAAYDENQAKPKDAAETLSKAIVGRLLKEETTP